MSSIQVLLLSALVVCTSCKHHSQRAAAPSGGEDPDIGSVPELQAGSRAEPSQVCVDDASTCEQTACSTATDCKPVTCQQASCVDGRCSYAPIPAGSSCGSDRYCSQTGSCGDCVPGTQRCLPGSATFLETCSESGIWQRTTCEGQACFNAQCTGECEPGSSTCEADKQRICGVDGRYGPATPCAAGSCSHGSCPAECQPGQARCLDLYRTQICNEAANWSPFTTCDQQRCDPTTGSCQTACSAGENRCVADKLSQCGSDGHWGAAVSCPNGCTVKGCNACRPNTNECLDAQNARTCAAEGHWQAPTPCPNGCRGQSCAACREGDLRCTTRALEACSPSGHWLEREQCPAGCMDNRCNACAPNTAECPSQQDPMLIRICKPDGTWKPTEGCRANARCAGGTGNTCPCNPGYRPAGQAGNPDAGDCVPL